ncbi:hypothetical protein E2562_027070 [Oryza meyeriana var. granulata]|uniref:Uncharacterized protein n=1 Tax=Oryza meyeriana var. granulata TaxID=110450 RepID=A0A6G1EZ65_9ORYZ|nr:hypothetical protein E2562_027070 [Oryza meyeriana var. granulata]
MVEEIVAEILQNGEEVPEEIRILAMEPIMFAQKYREKMSSSQGKDKTGGLTDYEIRRNANIANNSCYR